MCVFDLRLCRAGRHGLNPQRVFRSPWLSTYFASLLLRLIAVLLRMHNTHSSSAWMHCTRSMRSALPLVASTSMSAPHTFTAPLCHRLLHHGERILQQHLHERAPLHIDDADFSLRRAENNASLSRRTLRIIDGTEHPRLLREPRNNFLLVPDVIARSDDCRA